MVIMENTKSRQRIIKSTLLISVYDLSTRRQKTRYASRLQLNCYKNRAILPPEVLGLVDDARRALQRQTFTE
jgi:hypothetical protein